MLLRPGLCTWADVFEKDLPKTADGKVKYTEVQQETVAECKLACDIVTVVIEFNNVVEEGLWRKEEVEPRRASKRRKTGNTQVRRDQVSVARNAH